MKSNFLQGLESDLKSLVRTKWPDCPNSNWSELEWRRRRRPDDPYTNDDVITNESPFRSFIVAVDFYAKLSENTFEKWSQRYIVTVHAWLFFSLDEFRQRNHGPWILAGNPPQTYGPRFWRDVNHTVNFCFVHCKLHTPNVTDLYK